MAPFLAQVLQFNGDLSVGTLHIGSAKLNREVNVTLADPKLKARLSDLGGTVLEPADFEQAHRR